MKMSAAVVLALPGPMLNLSGMLRFTLTVFTVVESQLAAGTRSRRRVCTPTASQAGNKCWNRLLRLVEKWP
jgi:hypothetical protein